MGVNDLDFGCACTNHYKMDKSEADFPSWKSEVD